MNKTMLGLTIPVLQKAEVLEKIKKNMAHPADFFHIISLNAENAVTAYQQKNFKEVVEKAQIKLIDGVGIVVAGKILSFGGLTRYAGVDLMTDLLFEANKGRSTVMLIGGGPKIAELVVECQKSRFPGVNFIAFEGISDISNPNKEEEEHIFSIVADTKPQLLFLAFGSPAQELWIYKNRHKLAHVTVMGVGGAFDFLSGRVPRAPKLVRSLGFEWLFRLLIQPWRLKRQLRLLQFLYLVFKERLGF